MCYYLLAEIPDNYTDIHKAIVLFKHKDSKEEELVLESKKLSRVFAYCLRAMSCLFFR